MEDDDIARINGFLFCNPHGSEVCNKCCYDHRYTNNLRMKKQLSKAFPRLSQQDLQERPPLSNALAFAMDSGKKDAGGAPLYQCKLHNTIDCGTCFDWIRLAIENIKKASGVRNDIAIEASREEKLRLLACMGVELSPTTRLPEEAVDKRLKSAIDASQYFSSVITEVPLNPASFPTWSKSDKKNKPLLDAVRRGNPAEAMAVARANGQNPHPLFQNAFLDVRQTLMTMGNNLDNGCTEMILQDKGQDYAICLRVLEVRKITEGVPMFVVAYGRGAHNQPLSTTVAWIQGIIDRSGGTATQVNLRQIISTPQEQNLLLTILHANSKRLSNDYTPSRRKSEETFMLSFLLPIGPLSQQDIGKLANHSGCIVCGNKTVSKCSGCLSVEYCGRDCQKVHWKEHKPLCSSLKGGTWHTVNVSAHSLELRIMSMLEKQPIIGTYINNQTPLHPSTFNPNAFTTEINSQDPAILAPNIHGEKPFLIKIQCPADARARSIGASMLIYDRQRSFQAHLSAADDEKAYGEAMKQPEMATRLKIYRWAKRVGDRQLNICFDRPPPKDPLW
ncbi:hypothetical protein AAF712_000378 [Marasmius tenuissimus]|uniref:MYND-type domain-containing protein n=1 Tax=Marasmius tenuissimus TaxID=585030 RepID=A0ABR3AFB5_9AGAR